MNHRANDWLLHEPGAKDFGRVYAAVREQISESLEAELGKRPIFASVMALPLEQREALRQESWRRLERALAGDWAQYEEALRRDGAIYGALGMGFSDWYEIVTLWARTMIPALVGELSGDPARLSAALVAMQALTDAVMSVLGRAYVAASEQRLRDNEEDLAATLECIPDAVLVSDASGRVTRVNPSATRLLEAPAEAIVGLPIADVARLSSDPQMDIEGALLLQRGGQMVPVLAARSAIQRQDGTRTGEVVVLKDDRVHRERQVRLARWAAVFERVSWGMVIAADEGVIEHANAAFGRSYGQDPESFVGTAVQALYAPGELDRIRGERDEARRTGRITLEAMHRRPDGTEFPVRVDAAQIPGLGGRPSWVLSIHDLTTARQVEALKRRSEELEVENRRIEEASRMKSEFLANMSHELRTPLNSILGFSDLLAREEVGALSDEQRDFVSDIHASGKHLLRLINDVLDLSKVEAGKLELHPEATRMSTVLAEVTSVLMPISRERGIRIDQTVASDAEALHLDPGRLKQVLYNFLSNAIKFSPEGGTVAVEVRCEGPAAFRISVRDRGPGIAPADLERLFVEFEQLDSGRSKSHAGTGLGLALTRRLVEAQGGSVGVESTLGQGSTFYAILPLRAHTKTSLPRPRQIPGVVPGAPRILVVEDDAQDQERLVAALVAAGFAVDTAVTGAQALEAIHARAYDAITLDLLLPDTTGLSVLAALRKAPAGRSTPVIVVSVVTEHVTGGFVVHDVIEKPLDGASLVSSLARAGVVAPGHAPILIVDDDERSAKLAAATLAGAGWRTVTASNGAAALERANEERPAAVVLDLVMPVLDGFGFLEKFRADPRWLSVPVFVWTVKDLGTDEMRELAKRAERVLPKDGSGARTLVEQIREQLDRPPPSTVFDEDVPRDAGPP
ncbi:MAG: response regulator [Deltaproteobacteria bacterium]|nr:response regulator [Deltaproteobacteria bacterium]